jgi:NAD(P)-dependent dehydrogenase (short-subunit alcohol dehydrogenase family)
MSFSGRHVVVTGGAGALGAAVVEQLVEAGAHVHIPCIADVPDRLVGASGITATAGVNLSDEEAAVAFFASPPPLWASVHLAGTFTMAPLAETTAASVQRLFEINAMTCFLSCREATKRIREGGQGGRIVNVAARPVLVPTGGMTAYVASKSAVAGMTLALSEELAGEGILVNAIAPSIIDTPMNRSAMPDADYSTWPTPADLAATIVHLVSPANTSTRGAIVPVYGRHG